LLNQFSCHLSHPGSSFPGSVFNDEILAFNVAKLAHTLSEYLNISRERSGLVEKAYLSHLSWLLRLDWIKEGEKQPEHHRSNDIILHSLSLAKDRNKVIAHFRNGYATKRDL